MTINTLISDPKKRQARAQEKIDWILEFLRDEIYSTTAVLSRWLVVNSSATLSTLYRMEKQGLIVRDSIRFLGSRATTLWGITPTGVMEGVEPEEVATMSLRHFSPGRVSPRTIEHTLDIQKCRIYCDIELDYDNWIPTRLLPAQNERKGHPQRWSVYPDGIFTAPNKGKTKAIQVAIEVERTRKTPQRYVQIIRGHLKNVSMGRYFVAIYYCQTEKHADSLKVLFHRLIDEKKISVWIDENEYNSENCKQFFRFRTMEHIV